MKNSKGIGLATAFDGFYKFSDSDIAGKKLAFDAEGRFTAGAYQETLPYAGVSDMSEGAAVSETVALENDGETTITAQGDRAVLGWIVGGVTNASESATYACAAPADGAASVSIEVLYDNALYVDVENGSDDNDGITAAKAMKTFPAVMAKVRAGETVHAAAGVYDDRAGTMIQSGWGTCASTSAEAPTLYSRVVVPAGVTLEGESAENTIIKGGEDVRGVVLTATVSAKPCTLRNFTVTDGQAIKSTFADDDGLAGGVLGFNRPYNFIYDSVITNCTATRGGGTFQTTSVRSRYLGNSATNMGTAGRKSNFSNCYFSGNTGKGGVVQYDGHIVNCTFAADNMESVSTGTKAYVGISLTSFVNNLVLCGSGRAAIEGTSTLENCVFANGITMHSDVTSSAGCVWNAGEPSELVNADGTPRWGSSVIDAGKAVDTEDDIDLAGGQRVYNGAIDVGCFEYDWRDRYRRDLGSPRTLSVTKASADAVEQDGAVALKSGAIEIEWASGGKSNHGYSFTVEVKGEGTLTIVWNGESRSMTAADGKVKLEYKSQLDLNSLSFAYDGDDDGVVLDNFAHVSALAIILR